MATNKQILEARANRAELKAQAKQLKQEIARKTKELAKVLADLELADKVDDVFDGVPVSISEHKDTYDIRTIAEGRGNFCRTVTAYRHVRTKGWCVRVNEEGTFKPRFHGGKVLGLTDNWTYDQSREISKRWIIGDESVLADS